MGWYFGKAPTVNPSVTAAPCQLPQAGSLWGAQTKAPLAKGGCLGLPRRGDSAGKATDFFPIPSSLFPKKPSPFHMGSYFGKAPTVNPSVKNQRFLPAPFGKGAFGVQRRSPPGHCGGASATPRRGDSVAKATDFFPIPSSLFPKIARYRYRGINKGRHGVRACLLAMEF